MYYKVIFSLNCFLQVQCLKFFMHINISGHVVPPKVRSKGVHERIFLQSNSLWADFYVQLLMTIMRRFEVLMY